MSLHKILLTVLLAFTAIYCQGKSGDTDAGEKIVLRVAHNGSVHHPYNVGYEKFKEVLETETNGRVEVQIFPAEQLGTEEQTSQMVKVGTIAAAAASAGGGLAPFVPEAELFNFPFLFRDLEHFYRVVDGPIGQRVGLATEKALNYIMLGYWFVLQLLQGLPALGSTQGGVAFWAHIGGFVSGLVLINVFKRSDYLSAHRAQPQRQVSRHRWF